MKPLAGPIQTYLSRSTEVVTSTYGEVGSDPGHLVSNYSELVAKLAKLAFENPEFVLLLRGQTTDHREGTISSLQPTMFRTDPNFAVGYEPDLVARFTTLERAEDEIYIVLNNYGHRERVGRNPLARWAILQHYEICPTPLLDVTQSVLVACSFAWLDHQNSKANEAYLYVLGVPQIGAAISVSPAIDLQVVRLNSVCPPETLRPHFQEGYLIATYPNIDTLNVKREFGRSEMDCSRRLIAKFKFVLDSTFWDSGFSQLPKTALYPTAPSPLEVELENMRKRYNPNA